MKGFIQWKAMIAASFILLVSGAATAQDQSKDAVTIPKSELDELKRKAAELDQLKADFEKLKSDMQTVKAQTNFAGLPVAKPATSPLAAMPPLKKGEVVAADEIMNHFRVDPAAAEKRYGSGKVRVEGEIVSVSVPLFVRSYTVMLKTADPHWRIECNFGLPPEFKMLYSAKKGQKVLAETRSGVQATLATVGDSVVIEAVCRGAKDDEVKLGECRIVPVK